jgi:hypothetical protein
VKAIYLFLFTVLGAGCAPNWTPQDKTTDAGACDMCSDRVSGTTDLTGMPSASVLVDGAALVGARDSDATLVDAQGFDAVMPTADFVATERYDCIQPGECFQWPITSNEPGAKTQPSYTATTEVVVDQVTGLMWQRNTLPTYVGCLAGRVCTWVESRDYCDQLDLAGFQDWRLPRRMELFSILTFDEFYMGVDTKAFGVDNGAGYTADSAWSSSAWEPNPTFHFAVSYQSRSSSAEDSAKAKYPRCVRGGTTKTARYEVDVPHELVRDVDTGLIWDRKVSRPLDWDDAVTHCASRGPGWRLPSTKELFSLVQSGRTPAIDMRVFPDSSEERYWTSSKVPRSPTAHEQESYTIDFSALLTNHDSEIDRAGDSWPARVRCVRN